MSFDFLPQPTSPRWKPLRSGLINLFHYADEQFWYEDGRLLLRGNNGTGKSRVLALQLPFLLDAQLSPTRMEPDRSASKRPEWNLLLGGKHRDRLGYTWIEFARLDDAGQPEYFTLGCGLHAVEHRGGLDAWFFTTTDRIDRDLNLVVDSIPLTKSRLSESLGDDGRLYRTQGDYRRAVDEKLFRLGGRYGSLIDLLIQLRVPQLSRDFDEKRMSEQLSSALPPLSADVLAQVADAMRDLDEEREKLEEMRRSAVSVSVFREHYRAYLRIALKRRVEDLLSLHGKYDRTQRAINEDRRQHDEAVAELARAESQHRHSDTERKTVRARLAALRSRPEMEDARRLDDLRTDCQQLAVQTREASDASADAEQKHRDAKKLYSQVTDEAKWEEKRTRTAAQDLTTRDLPESVRKPLRSVIDDLLNTPSSARKLEPVEKAWRICFEATQTLLRHRQEIEKRNSDLRRQIDRQSDLEARLEEHQQTLSQRTTMLRVAGAELRRLLDSWFEMSSPLLSSLTDRQEWGGAWDDEQEYGPNESELLEENPLELVIESINDAVEAKINELAGERHALEAEVRLLESAIGELETQRQQLLDGVHSPPPSPHFRDPGVRATRQGAPFYELCDFRETIPNAERPNWEAALEASGLLDAWVTLDGTLDDPMLADVTLLSAPPIVNEMQRLTCILCPSSDLPNGMSSDVVERLLASIGCGKETATAWVDGDGTWQVGPACGAWTKPHAEHIGATARKIRQQQQIQVLTQQITSHKEKIAEYKEQIAKIDKHRQDVQERRRAIPSDQAFRDAIASRRESEVQCLKGQQLLNEQLARVGDARAGLESIVARRDRDASDFGLLDRVQRLDELQVSLNDFRQGIQLLRRDLDSFAQRLASVERARQALDSADKLMQKERRLAKEFSDALAEKLARLETLQSSVGKDVELILAEIQAEENREKQIEDQLQDLQMQVRRCDVTKGRLDEKLKLADETLSQHEENRRLAIGHVMSLCDLGLAKQALESSVDSENAGTIELPDTPWSPTRAAVVAKDIRDTLRDVSISDKAWDTAQNETWVQFRSLEQSLLPTGVTPQSQMHDEVTVITVPYQGVICSPSDLSRQLNEEVRHRESLITQRERELFEQRLIGDIAQSLHQNIREADSLCQRMNAEVESRPMSTGMRLRFRWHPIVDSSEELKVACKALLRKPSAMSDDDRVALGQFLQQQIAEARSRDDVGTWQQHLAESLDYRLWFTFDIERETDGRWQRLTRRTHGTGSGGERAVALIIPMLAALAAYYHSADRHAPRIILMDEAFVGIDNEMRSKFMDLMVQFDLDFVMTSEREWGCYPTMPALAIYHLSTRRGIDAILPTRWVWNGNGKSQSDVHDLARQKALFDDQS